MADPRGHKRPAEKSEPRKKSRQHMQREREMDNVRRQLRGMAIDRADRARAKAEEGVANVITLPNEIMNLIFEFTDLKTTHRFAAASRDAHARALFSNVKAVSDAIRDLPVFIRGAGAVDNSHNTMLVQNVLYVLAKYASEKQLFRIIQDAYPKKALLWPDNVRFTKLDVDYYGDPLENLYEVDEDFDTLDQKSKMIDRLVAMAGFHQKYELLKRDDVLEDREDEIDDGYDDYDSKDNFDDENDFNQWAVGHLEEIKELRVAITRAEMGMSGELSLAEQKKEVPFLITLSDLSDPEMKQLRRVVGFVWQAIPRNKEQQAKSNLMDVIAQYRVKAMALHRQDNEPLRMRMQHAGNTRFNGPDQDLIDRDAGENESVLTRQGEVGNFKFFSENQYPDPTMGLPYHMLLRELGELVVDTTIDVWEEDPKYLTAEVVVGQLEQGVEEMIDWWMKIGEHFGFPFFHGDQGPDAGWQRPFTNLAQFINLYLYQMRDENQKIAGMTYTNRLITWHKKLKALILRVVPDLAPKMQVDADIGHHHGSFAFYEGVRRLYANTNKSHFKNALLRRK